jgi:hypothetical protein
MDERMGAVDRSARAEDLPTMSCAAAPTSIPNKIIPSSSMVRSYSLLAGSWSSSTGSRPERSISASRITS